MTAVISGVPESTEPLAPAGSSTGPDRAPAGAFDVLIALLQGGMPQAALLHLLEGAPMQPPSADASAFSGESEAEAWLGRSPRGPLPMVRGLLVDPGVLGNVAVADQLALGLDAPIVRGADEERLPSASEATVGLPPVLALAIATTPTPISAAASERIPAGSNARTMTAEMMETRPGLRPVVASPTGAPPASGGGLGITAGVGLEVEPAASQGFVPGLTPLEIPRELDEPRPSPLRSARAFAGEHAVDGAPALAAEAAAHGDVVDVVTRVTRRDESHGPDFRLPGGTAADDAAAPADATRSESTVAGLQGPAVSMAPRAGLGDIERANAHPAREPIDQIATRLREVKTPGRHELSLRLDPPDLGTVRIEARLEGPRLHVQIRAEHAPTRDLLADALPRLRESLAQQGFVPTEVSVQLGFDASGRQFTRDSTPMFTPPSDGEPAPLPKVVRTATRVAAASDGLDVWA
jgi:hypothetical protein